MGLECLVEGPESAGTQRMLRFGKRSEVGHVLFDGACSWGARLALSQVLQAVALSPLRSTVLELVGVGGAVEAGALAHYLQQLGHPRLAVLFNLGGCLCCQRGLAQSRGEQRRRARGYVDWLFLEWPPVQHRRVLRPRVRPFRVAWCPTVRRV